MILPQDTPWSQPFLEEEICDDPLKPVSQTTEEASYTPFPFKDDFYRPDQTW
ncbi:MAG: hypothetical protein E7L17_03275 [Clostridium sp.]|uniref:hypothetical protein n=1 Tax=Clostridium sp. TaxID=1506 RepID=UPI002911E3A5|nr:hypothetical protein [Clostridium sp.]MDU7337117.1 hypothetical protein [Clostridium sp.]